MGKRRARRSGPIAIAAVLAALGHPGAASAAAPDLGELWAAGVSAQSARLGAALDPKGLPTTYHFDYIPTAAFGANLGAGKDGFAGALRSPASEEAKVTGTAPTELERPIFGLAPNTAYRYRILAKNADGQATSAPGDFATFELNPPLLAEGRGWELVSPPEKNGGRVDPPGTLLGGGLLQAAADGHSVTYSSAASFAGGGQGAAPASQYLARRTAGGWSSENLTAPALAGSYGEDGGVPYRLFSTDLARALMGNGDPCRGEGTGCPVPNPPLAGTDAPAGYENYYLRESDGGFEALLGSADLAQTEIGAADFRLGLAGASPDLRHSVLSSCAALTANATEVPLGAGCDPAKPNLYRHSAGALTLINLLAAQSVGTPGAELAAPAGAVSAEGTRVYWTDGASGNLHLREGSATKQVDAEAGGGGSFEAASADGATAFFTAAGHLWRYEAPTEEATDLTPAGGVIGVLGASEDASRLYYLSATGLFLREGATTRKVAEDAEAANYPPATGTARVSADGRHLLFSSTASLSGYDNTDLITGEADSQLYLYDAAGPGALTCVSCNPTGARPIGPSSVPGALANGKNSPRPYKPRVLSWGGRRVFFESRDALALGDVNVDPTSSTSYADVYQWRGQGVGGCGRPGGCVSLISSGRSEADAHFLDASADGSDAFFLTERSLLGADSGAIDLYDARIGGGFPEAPEPFPCDGDACQIVPPEPQNPTLTTVLAGPGNPAERFRNYKRCPKGKVRKAVRVKGKRAIRCVRAKGKAKTERGGRR